jgi:cell division septal protein FtsQ
MWQSVAAFLASSKFMAMLAENVMKQGFTVLLLIAGILWMQYQIIGMQMKIDQMQVDIISYYRDDRVRTEKVLEDATYIMKQLYKKLDDE